jgi:regulation of enolase protein 1 (concanavalin A-like superfamily)
MGKKLAMTTMVMVIVGLIGPAAIGQGDPSLMGWWKFDGDALDASGNNRSGTLVGDTAFRPGLFGQALILDGTGDYVNITGYKGILGANAFSVALWVNTTGNGTMVNWGTNANGQRVDLRLDQGRLRVEHGNGNLQGKTVLNDGQWHHVVLTVAAGASISYPSVIFYLDGKDDSQTTTDPDTFNIVANVDVTIGRRQTNSDRAIPALLDEVRIYDRVLTAAEVQALALLPKAMSPDPADKAEGVVVPVLRWKPRQTAVWHDVYLGTSAELSPADLVSPRQLASSYYHVAGMTPGTTYYWKVDEIELDGTVYPGDVWSFTFASFQAWKPVPADGEPCTDPNLTLTWMPGLDGLSHDVYFGADETGVAEGTSDTFKGKLLLPSYAAGLLQPGATYYWRVDEVNAVGGKVKGPVWRFTTLPVIPIDDPNLVGWWTFDEGRGSRVVDWSGHGRHGTLIGTPTWADGYDGMGMAFDGPLSGDYVEITGYPGVLGKQDRTVAAWIQTTTTGDIVAWGLATDTQKWNFRVQTDNGNDGSLRLEVQGGRICGWTDLRDGEWHHVAATLQSTGAPTVSNIGLYVDGVQEAISDSLVVDVNTVPGTRSVRIGDGHQLRPVLGLLDDVRIYDRALTQEELDTVMRIDPLRAWRPYPATGSIVDIRTATPLTWMPGDSASKHEVYLGVDAVAVAAADTSDATGIYQGQTSATSFTPAAELQWGQKYSWRVDEINPGGAVTKGRVWTFTVADYLIVDDFESYTDDIDNRIFQTWLDGYGYTDPEVVQGNGTGSTVGNTTNPFAERRAAYVYSGSQAMPMDYNNAISPYYSEAERTWTTPQNWLFNDVNTLVLHFRGEPVEYLQVAPDHIIMSAAGWDIWHDTALTRFDEFRFVYKRLTGDGTIIARVDSITNTNVWAKGGVMMRESLDWAARHASVFVTPGQGVAFQRRLANNDAGLSTAQAGIVAPHWIKLTRTGDLLTAQHSADGVTWGDVVNATSPTSDTVVMGGTIYIGLALTSHSAGVACTAEFSAIQVTGNVAGQWEMAEIGVDHPGNSADSLYIAIQDSSNRTAVLTHPDPAAVTSAAWQRWTIDLAGLKSAGVNLKAVKKMYVGVGDRNNPQPDGVGRLYIEDIRISKGVPVEPNAVP